MAREQKYQAVIQKAVLKKRLLDRLSLCLSGGSVLEVVVEDFLVSSSGLTSSVEEDVSMSKWLVVVRRAFFFFILPSLECLCL